MIPFLDLKAINALRKKEVLDAIEEVYDSANFILGSKTSEFESQFAEYIGTKHAIGVGNGLDGLSLMLKCFDFEEGSEILVSANTFIATVLAITANNLKPIFIEPELNSFNIDPALIEEKITPKTKGLLLVHLYGGICDMNKISELCKKHDIKLFEDCAQAAGADINGRKAGSWGDAAAFSFYPAKNFGGIGDGGAVTTNYDEIANKMLAMRNYGSFVKYENLYKGTNSRLDEIQAAVLQIKLKYLDAENDYRREIARYYLANIRNSHIDCPADLHGRQHVWHLFVVRARNREHLKSYLSENGVQTIIHYPIPIHKQDAYREFQDLVLPVTEKIHKEVLSLPIGPTLSREEAARVVEVINKYKP